MQQQKKALCTMYLYHAANFAVAPFAKFRLAAVVEPAAQLEGAWAYFLFANPKQVVKTHYRNNLSGEPG